MAKNRGRAPTTVALQKARAAELLAALTEHYPDAHCELNYATPHELLIATILSAQCTDVAVNRATPALFKAFPTPKDYANSTAAAIEPYLRSIGLFRNKAKAVHATCTMLTERFGGEVPRTMEELLLLRGVARKTANVVLGNCFGINEGIVVDTHVMRLAHRLGLSKATTPTAIERDLMKLFEQESWCVLSHLLISHGRRACKARGGLCTTDPICLKFCSEARARKTSSPRGKKVASKRGTSR